MENVLVEHSREFFQALVLVCILFAIFVFQKNVAHFARLSAVLGFFIILVKWAGWQLLFEDMNPFAIVTFALSGRSLSNLVKKFFERRRITATEKTKKDVEREFRWALAFLTCGAVLFAYTREKREIRKGIEIKTVDANACANFGGCKAGPEGFPEMTFNSILFGTRFISDMKLSGALFHPEPEEHHKWKCDFNNVIIPMIINSRYSVPRKKIWQYDSTAVKISCRDYKIANARNEVREDDVSIDITQKTSSKFRVNIEKNYMNFSLCFQKVKVRQTSEKIETKTLQSCEPIPEFLDTLNCSDKELRTAFNSAIRSESIRKDKLSYWKIMSACILNDFNEPHNININDLRVYDLVETYLSTFGNVITIVFLFIAISFICIDELDESQHGMDFIEQVIEKILFYIESHEESDDDEKWLHAHHPEQYMSFNGQIIGN